MGSGEPVCQASPSLKSKVVTNCLPYGFRYSGKFFIVFRQKEQLPKNKKNNFPSQEEVMPLKGNWTVQFDRVWGGPAKPVTFHTLSDWTTNSTNGIRYFSGTAVYTKTFDVPFSSPAWYTIILLIWVRLNILQGLYLIIKYLVLYGQLPGE